MSIKPQTKELNNDHEYYEITDEKMNNRFETLDFGPSLMDEVFKELDSIKPELTEDLNGQQRAINDCNLNVKNEIKEIVSKLAYNKDKSTKNKGTVKSISPAEEQNLDSAIAMAKELANLSMMDYENKSLSNLKNSSVNDLSDSPKTPTSPTKKKFSFKFRNSPKVDRKNFSQKTENVPGIQSIITEEAKVAYISLIEKGTSHLEPRSPTTVTASASASPVETETTDLNPLRLLRNGFSIIPKVKGNKQRIAATPQTASLARLTANVNRSTLGAPPPPPTPTAAHTSSMSSILSDENLKSAQPVNPLPLPPRVGSKMQLPSAPLKHPQILPGPSTSLTSPNSIGPVSASEAGSSLDSSFTVINRNTSDSSYPNYVNYGPDCQYSSQTSHCPKRTSEPPPKPSRTFFPDESPLPKPNPAPIHPSVTQITDNNRSVSSDKNTSLYAGSMASAQPVCTNPSPFIYTTANAAPGLVNPSLTRTFDSKEPDPDEVRVMQKVLAHEIHLSSDECVQILRTTGCDIYKAIKCVRVREILRSHAIDINCNWAETLARFNWNTRQASNYLIATQGLPDNSTEV